MLLLAAPPVEPEYSSGLSWQFHPRSNNFLHCNEFVRWPEQQQLRVDMGDTVRLELDLDRQTLRIYVNDVSFGAPVWPGQTVSSAEDDHYLNHFGDLSVNALVGPLQWTLVGVNLDVVGDINGPLPPLQLNAA